MIKKYDYLVDDERENKIITPTPDYKFIREDVLVLFGQDDKINKFLELLKDKRKF